MLNLAFDATVVKHVQTDINKTATSFLCAVQVNEERVLITLKKIKLNMAKKQQQNKTKRVLQVLDPLTFNIIRYILKYTITFDVYSSFKFICFYPRRLHAFLEKKKQQNNNKKQSSEKQQNENIKTETTQACKTGRENIIHRK
jgi:hypothetical protein